MRTFKAVSLLTTIAVLAACTRVDETEHCVEIQYGNVTTPKLKPGLVGTFVSDIECFSLTEQNYPAAQGDKEEIGNTPTKDTVVVSGDVAMTWEYNKATLYEKVFIPKRRHEAVLPEIQNALRSGFRDAIATVESEDLIGPKRSSMDSVVRVHVQRKLGDLATVKKVFIRDIVLPKSLTQARENIVKQAADLTEALNKRQIAEANAAANIATARGESESNRLRAQSYASAPKVLDLEIAKEYAKICANATTCILGASALDRFLGGKP